MSPTTPTAPAPNHAADVPQRHHQPTSGHDPLYAAQGLRERPEPSRWATTDQSRGAVSGDAWTQFADVLLDFRIVDAGLPITGHERRHLTHWPTMCGGPTISAWQEPRVVSHPSPTGNRTTCPTFPANSTTVIVFHHPTSQTRVAVAVTGKDDWLAVGRLEALLPNLRGHLAGIAATRKSRATRARRNYDAVTLSPHHFMLREQQRRGKPGQDVATLCRAAADPTAWFGTENWAALDLGVHTVGNFTGLGWERIGAVTPLRLLLTWSLAGFTTWQEAAPWASTQMLPNDVTAWHSDFPGFTDDEIRAWYQSVGATVKGRGRVAGWVGVDLPDEVARRWARHTADNPGSIKNDLVPFIRAAETARWRPEHARQAVMAQTRRDSRWDSGLCASHVEMLEPWLPIPGPVAVGYLRAGMGHDEALAAEAAGNRPSFETFDMLAGLRDLTA